MSKEQTAADSTAGSATLRPSDRGYHTLLQANPAGVTGPSKFVSSHYTGGEQCDLVDGHRSSEVRC